MKRFAFRFRRQASSPRESGAYRTPSAADSGRSSTAMRPGRSALVLALSACLLAASFAVAQKIQDRSRSPHGNLKVACQNCHTATSWKPIRPAPDFNHNETRYPLRGMHAGVSCRECHLKLIFSNVGGQCADCHADIHRRQMGGNCEQCHTVRGWRVSMKAVQQHQNRFPLLGGHAAADCEACHKGAAVGQYLGLSTECASCHMRNFQNTTSPSHTAANLPTTCELCHSSMDTWHGARFDHARFTNFALTGTHAQLDCVSCHVGGRYAGTPADCYSCHTKDYAAATDPNHVAAGFPKDCGQCHTTVNWDGAKFDHRTLTKFPLTGAHATVACKQCHVNNRFAGTPTDCASCHTADYNSTTDPSHAAAAFPKDCSLCHTTTNWLGAVFDHSKTPFPLTGAHTKLDCKQCHANNVFAGTPVACSACHLSDFNKTTNPNHVTAGFPQDCTICHNTTQWQGAKFDHNTATKFALTGVHATLTCNQCHANNVFAGTPAACSGCHLADFNKTTSPNHVAAGFPQDCSLCHTTATWLGAVFDHSKTPFPLTGAHTKVDCSQCHANNRFAGTPTQCVACHLADFNKAANPNHVSAGFPQDCTICHNTTQWPGAKFDHNTATKFALTGVHATLTCNQCHANNVFAGTPAACSGCHLADYNKTTNPNHTAAGFPQDCSLCHTTATWQGAVFDHSKTTFPLTGAHTKVDCTQCHANNKYAGTPTACVACHLADFNNSTNPSHVAAGFPQDCTLCHTTTQWPGAKFDHNTATKFTLTGAHVSLTCKQCHASNVFAGTPTACSACHLADYNKTTNPNHSQAGFPQDCSLCHSTINWTDATFDHSKTKFPLTGAHASQPCLACHANGQYATLATTCQSCHLARFNVTTSPNHVTAGFPQDCSICHSTTAWTPASFDHSKTKFPLTGAHVGVQCSQCHINAVYAGTPTDCYSCHSAVYKSTTNPNHVAAGFPTTCQTCHTTTTWSGATFNHTWFPTNHGRAGGVCATCHTNPADYKVFQCTVCHTKTQMDSQHRNVNGYVYNSANCYQCHPRGSGG